jgi:tRNA A37 threonylcarbamoyladenosine dehydratase
MLIGTDALEKLKSATVAVFGVGGVGGYAVEALARAGVGRLVLVDSDVVSLSNINRQIIATHRTVGMYKTEAMRDRLLEINPDIEIELHTVFFDETRVLDFDFSSYDYVVDAIDSIGAKIELIVAAKSAGTPIISAMGAGNKLDPTRFEISDISKTEVCPLARAVRTRLRKRGINNLKVVYSKELPHVANDGERVPASISFVPSAMGLVIASAVVKDITEI